MEKVPLSDEYTSKREWTGKCWTFISPRVHTFPIRKHIFNLKETSSSLAQWQNKDGMCIRADNRASQRLTAKASIGHCMDQEMPVNQRPFFPTLCSIALEGFVCSVRWMVGGFLGFPWFWFLILFFLARLGDRLIYII